MRCEDCKKDREILFGYGRKFLCLSCKRKRERPKAKKSRDYLDKTSILE